MAARQLVDYGEIHSLALDLEPRGICDVLCSAQGLVVSRRSYGKHLCFIEVRQSTGEPGNHPVVDAAAAVVAADDGDVGNTSSSTHIFKLDDEKQSMRISSASTALGGQQSVEHNDVHRLVVFCNVPHMNPEDIKRVFKECKLGDKVEFYGYPSKDRLGYVSFICTRMSLVQKYHGPKRFLPERRVFDIKKPDIRPLCRFFRRAVACPAHDSCLFRHHFVSQEEEELTIRQRAKAESIRHEEHDESDPFDGGKNKHSLRADVFTKWLIETFKLQRLIHNHDDNNNNNNVDSPTTDQDHSVKDLNELPQVLDVAGGKGNIAFQLHSIHGIPCTVIDGRPLSFSKPMRKHFKKRPNEQFGFIQTLFDQQFIDDPRNESLLKRVGLIIGMHPDQATECIVDYALSRNLPFAVVPCCVFVSEFPDRRFNGQQVVSYQDFISYLQAKDPRIQLGYLDFVGRHKVLYMIP
eukprot:GILK01008881.1.p1 GENE.GILK01008881.1~~GILK01008881.1.p1  ORF type:complete len:481 (+),score=73.03 GILK01008881.1:54-1445(+)